MPRSPASSPPPTPALSPAPPACTGPGCIPQPITPAPLVGEDASGQPDESGDGRAECGITSIGGCVTNAINDFFRGIVTEALNPLLELLSTTLLTTPSPRELPRVGQLWSQSWEILLACYVLLVIAAGVVLMAYESLQARYSIKEIAPRLVVGFLAGALSLVVTTQAIEVANALSGAVMGGGVDAVSASATMRDLVTAALSGDGIFVTFLGIFLVVALIVLLLTYLVRVALTIILIVGAPLALMWHALPQTEGIAFWWWRAFFGCLRIQIVQSLTLITGIRVFLAPGGFTPFGATTAGLVNLLVALALLYILIKIPFWILGSMRGGRRSLVGSAARAYVLGKTLGLLGGRSGVSRRPSHPGGGGPGRGGTGGGGGLGPGGGNGPRPGGGGGPGPGGGRGPRGGGGGPVGLPSRVRGDTDGHHDASTATGTRGAAPTPQPGGSSAAVGRRRAPYGRQLATPPGDGRPQNKPVLGRPRPSSGPYPGSPAAYPGRYSPSRGVRGTSPRASARPTTPTLPSRHGGNR